MTVTESVPEEWASAQPPALHEGILRRQSARESAARTYARALPIVPVRARGLTVEGADGRRYLDCLSGAGTLALGHNHPVVLEAIRKVLDSGAPLHALDLATPVKDAFVTELFRTLPPGLAERARVQFCGPAGTDAVEAAFTLVRAATGRTGIAAFTGAYHGMTAGAAAASGHAVDVRVARLPYPQDYRCPFGVGGPRGAALAARWTESVLDDPKSGVPLPAGMILEPVQGEGGVLPAPDDWLRRMRQITAERSVPLIADEIQTGVGRTGAFWAVQHSGVVPDVMVLSKAIGGSLPLAVVVYRDDLDVWEPGAHAGTFRGNQLAMAAGTATLAHVRENRLAERAAHLLPHARPAPRAGRGTALHRRGARPRSDDRPGTGGPGGRPGRHRRPVGGGASRAARRPAARRARPCRRRAAGMPAAGTDRRTRRPPRLRGTAPAAADDQRRAGGGGARPAGRRDRRGGPRPHRARRQPAPAGRRTPPFPGTRADGRVTAHGGGRPVRRPLRTSPGAPAAGTPRRRLAAPSGSAVPPCRPLGGHERTAPPPGGRTAPAHRDHPAPRRSAPDPHRGFF